MYFAAAVASGGGVYYDLLLSDMIGWWGESHGALCTSIFIQQLLVLHLSRNKARHELAIAFGHT